MTRSGKPADREVLGYVLPHGIFGEPPAVE